GAVRPGSRQAARVGLGYRRFGRRRLHDQRFQHLLGLHAVVGTGLGDGGRQRQAVFVRGQVDGRAGLGAVHRAGAGVFTPLLGRLFGAIHEDLVPVDAVQLLVALGQLLPGLAEAVLGQPEAETLLNRVGAREAGGDVVPADAGDEDVEQALQAGVI